MDFMRACGVSKKPLAAIFQDGEYQIPTRFYVASVLFQHSRLSYSG
jgi:hypothetical protein